MSDDFNDEIQNVDAEEEVKEARTLKPLIQPKEK